jgi:hypothetical protein
LRIQYQRYLDARALSDSVPTAARAAAEDFGYVIGSNELARRHSASASRKIATTASPRACPQRPAWTRSPVRGGERVIRWRPTGRWLTEREPVLRAGRISAIEWRKFAPVSWPPLARWWR